MNKLREAVSTIVEFLDSKLSITQYFMIIEIHEYIITQKKSPIALEFVRSVKYKVINFSMGV